MDELATGRLGCGGEAAVCERVEELPPFAKARACCCLPLWGGAGNGDSCQPPEPGGAVAVHQVVGTARHREHSLEGTPQPGKQDKAEGHKNRASSFSRRISRSIKGAMRGSAREDQPWTILHYVLCLFECSLFP